MTGYGNRGMTFEGLIEYANRRYWTDGTANIRCASHSETERGI